MSAIVFIADAWGPKFGGINSLNQDLCLATVILLKEKHKVLCITTGVSDTERKRLRSIGLDIINIEKKQINDAKIVLNTFNDICTEKMIYWIGHDIITGEVAIECAEMSKGKSVIIHHMNYIAYYLFKSNDPIETLQREKLQKKLINNANYVIGIGPLLKASAEDKINQGENKTVHELIPGLASLDTIDKKRNSFSVITFGRVEENNNIIKQTKLAVASFAKAYRDNKDEFEYTPQMRVIGYDKVNNDKVNELIRYVEKYAKGVVSVFPLQYTENREELFEMLCDSDLCMMLSFHEGFGLVGYETIAAGVPLILSKNSGLYKFLQSLNLNEYVYGVQVDASYIENEFSEDDLKGVSDALIKIYRYYNKYKENAIKLKSILLQKGYTWEQTAKSLLEILHIDCIKESKKIESNLFLFDETNKNNNDQIYKLDEIQVNKKNFFSREKLNEQMQEKIGIFNLIVVQGTSGNGKNYFVDSYFKHIQDKYKESEVYIYEIRKNESYDEFYLNMKTKLKIENLNRRDQYKKLLNYFKSNVLIIKSFHKADLESFDEFLKYVIDFENKINIIIITDTYFDNEINPNIIGKIKVNGFDKEEISEYFEKYNCKIDDKYIDLLCEKEHGKPNIVFKFLYNIKDKNILPEEIFKRNILKNLPTNIKAIEKIAKRLTKESVLLMQILSLRNTPFNYKFMIFAVNEMNKNNTLKINLNKSLGEIKNNFLIEDYSDRTSHIAEYIGNYFENLLDDKLKSGIYNIIGRYYAASYIKAKKTESLDQSVVWGLQSCQYFQLAKNYIESEKLLEDIRKYAMKIGCFELYVRACEKQQKEYINSSKWFSYNRCKIYLILGQLHESKRILKYEFKNIITIEDNNLLTSFIRLKAEIEYEQLVDTKLILEELEKNSSIIDFSKLSWHIISQFYSVKASLLINCDQYKDADIILSKMLEGEEENPSYGTAIALVKFELINFKQNLNISINNLLKAIDIFAKLNDKRGEAWACYILGFIAIKQKLGIDGLYEYLERGISANKEMNIYSKDYYNILVDLESDCLGKDLEENLKAEISRLQLIYN